MRLSLLLSMNSLFWVIWIMDKEVLNLYLPFQGYDGKLVILNINGQDGIHYNSAPSIYQTLGGDRTLQLHFLQNFAS